VGSSFFSTETFYSEIYRAPVFVFQDQVKSVQSDGLPSVQLGKINHSFFGESSASITAQLAISNNPIFGNYSQEQEDLADGTEPSIIQENERVTSVFFEVPFYNNQNDFDQDGVIDYLDIDPKDPDSDSDSDGLSDFSENAVGTNPLSNDSDNDGILDNEDTDSSSYDPENKVYEIDSVYGNKDSKFNIKIHELTYYLNLLDPYNNFETYQQFFSDANYFDQGFYSTEFFNDEVVLNYEELRYNYLEDIPETEDIDETTKVEFRYSPRIRLELKPDYFQENFIDLEGSTNLKNIANFQQHIKGVIIQTTNFTDDIYLLLNFDNAAIKVNYEYDSYNDKGTTTDASDDEIIRESSSYDITLGGIRINNLNKSGHDPIISLAIAESNSGIPQEKIVIQGGQFFSRINLFDAITLNDNNELLQLKNNNWLINEANLIFYIDKNQQSYYDAYVPERLYLYNLDSGEPINDFIIDNTINTRATNAGKEIFSGLLEYDSNDIPWRYKFRITDHINKIIRKDSLNQSLGLVSGANVSYNNLIKAYNSKDEKIKFPATGVLNPFGVVLIGSHPLESSLEDKKAELEIYYTKY
tara:strand:+ start:24714 stop:26465 length:1752 start_codon:yes stop_codon:yes gene_type:complete